MSGRCGSISKRAQLASSASAPSTSASRRVEVALQNHDRQLEPARERLLVAAQRRDPRELELDLELAAAKRAFGRRQRLRHRLVAPLDAHEVEQRALDREPKPPKPGSASSSSSASLARFELAGPRAAAARRRAPRVGRGRTRCPRCRAAAGCAARAARPRWRRARARARDSRSRRAGRRRARAPSRRFRNRPST